MTYVITMFDNFDDAEKAVNMLVERKYPAESITVIAGERDGSHRELSGEEVADTGDDDSLADIGRRLTGGIFGDIVGRRGHERTDDELAQDVQQAGVGADQVASYADRIRQGAVLVTVETEDFRAEDVQNILDNAAGRDLERLLTEPAPDTGPDVETQIQASAGGDGSASGFA